MEETSYCVKFIRNDQAIPPVEKYYFNTLSEAKSQFDFFKNTLDPDYPIMYKKIQLLIIQKNLSIIKEEIKYHK